MTAVQHRRRPHFGPSPFRGAARERMRDPLHPMHQLLLARVTAMDCPVAHERFPGVVRLTVAIGGAVCSWALVAVAVRVGATLI